MYIYISFKCVEWKSACVGVYQLLNMSTVFSRYSDSLRAGRFRDRIPVRERISASVQTGFETHPASYTMNTGCFPGVKRPGRGVEHPIPYNAEVNEILKPYVYSTSGPSWSLLGWNLPYLLLFFLILPMARPYKKTREMTNYTDETLKAKERKKERRWRIFPLILP